MDSSSSCSPVARPLKEILGDNVSTLQVGEMLKDNDEEHADGSTKNQASYCYNATYTYLHIYIYIYICIPWCQKQHLSLAVE